MRRGRGWRRMGPTHRARVFGASLAGVLGITGLLAQEPVVETLTREPVDSVSLVFSAGYLLSAPFGGLWDALSLLTDRQHVAVLVSVAGLFVAWRLLRLALPTSRPASIGRELLTTLAALVGLLAFYGYGVLGLRPMASLQADDPELAIVDFHSHTEASHDGRPGLDLQTRRGWHRAAGYDIAFVTDHAHVQTALGAGPGNPDRAGEGTSLLPGREVRFKDQHVLVLGTQDPTGDIPRDHPWPTLIQTIPNDLSRVPIPARGRWGGVHAIELIDGDPRGLRQGVEERELILAIADSLDLALIAGSNHHGWGRTAAGWNLVRVPGWRSLPPQEAARRVEAVLRNGRGGNAALRVVERRRMSGGTAEETVLSAASTLPRLAWHLLTGLTPSERLAWLGWVALATLLLSRFGSKTARLPIPVEPE